MAIMNANIIFSKKTNTKLSLLEFKSKLIYQIVEKYKEPTKRKSPSISPIPNPLRLTGRHFPSLFLDANGEKSRRKSMVCAKTSTQGKKKLIMNANFAT